MIKVIFEEIRLFQKIATAPRISGCSWFRGRFLFRRSSTTTEYHLSIRTVRYPIVEVKDNYPIKKLQIENFILQFKFLFNLLYNINFSLGYSIAKRKPLDDIH